MAYEYKKLSEVEAIDVADSSVNLIVETEDEIKKLNIGDLPIGGQEQADWNEEDATQASFIRNKPDLSQVGGGVKTTYLNTNGFASLLDWSFEDGTPLTAKNLFNALQEGSVIIKFETPATLGVAEGTAYCPILSYKHCPEQEVMTDTGNTLQQNAWISICYLNYTDKVVYETQIWDY